MLGFGTLAAAERVVLKIKRWRLGGGSHSSKRTLAPRSLGAVALVAAACAPTIAERDAVDPTPIGESSHEVQGDNLAGTNLGGVNLAGTNLAGTNLGGANLGGNNLAGTNLAGTNLAGTNLGGNNLGGNNLAGTNLAGTNLAGTNLGGSNLAGTNLAGTNLGGSNLAGTNLGGNNLAGTNLAGTNLAGGASGKNIHNLSGSINGMLYSGEDLWKPPAAPYNGTNSGQCIVMGIGSTAFAKLLGQQTANAKISVALGKLPWGFSGGAAPLSAWEATIWGDKTYCTFILAAPSSASWAGIAGFIKAVFRWNAPSTQSMDISGIESSAPVDPTLNVAVTNYYGMMNAAARFRDGTINETTFVAGLLAFLTATTNNQSVTVDFASWVRDKNKNAYVLGNVQSNNPPTYAEAVYIALDNGDGTTSIIIDDAARNATSMPAGMTNTNASLKSAYQSWQAGTAPKPIPRRCAGALYANYRFGEPVPIGKCDDGLTWASGSCITGSQSWSSVTAIWTGPNTYMQLTQPGGLYQRSQIVNGACAPLRPVLSETYVHLWTKGYDLNLAFNGTPDATGVACNATTADKMKAFDNRNAPSNGTKWCVQNVPSSSNPNQLEYTFSAGTYYAITSYDVTSANDIPQRDPRDWTLQGCGGSCSLGSDTGWTTLDARTGQTFAYRWQTNSYSFNNTWAYPQIRFKVTANAAAGQWTQLGELQLFDTNGCAAQSNSSLCASYGKNCGTFTAVDNCGATRTVSSCGSCSYPNQCSGGGVANVCGSGSPAICFAPYAQSSCLSYGQGSQVSSGGRNWTCANANCSQCAVATYQSSCAPGGTGCPWGVVWQDNGPCH